MKECEKTYKGNSKRLMPREKRDCIQLPQLRIAMVKQIIYSCDVHMPAVLGVS